MHLRDVPLLCHVRPPDLTRGSCGSMLPKARRLLRILGRRPLASAENTGALVPRAWSVVNYSPMVAGLLTGKMTADRIQKLPADDWRRKNVEFNAPRLQENLALVERLRAVGDRHGVSRA